METFPELRLSWAIGGKAGSVSLPYEQAWTFGRAMAPGLSTAFQHDYVSRRALQISHLGRGARVERFQIGNGARLLVDRGSTVESLAVGASCRTPASGAEVVLEVKDFRLVVRIHPLEVQSAATSTRVPLDDDLRGDRALLLQVLVAVLSRSSDVQRPEVVRAVSIWTGEPELHNTPFYLLLDEALARLGHSPERRHAAKFGLLVSAVRGLFDDRYLDQVAAELRHRTMLGDETRRST